MIEASSFMAKDSPAMESSSPGFAFKKRLERVDWRKIASIDVDSISRNLDFNVLQENIQHITFCNIETELDVQTVDPSFVKLFRLAQLTIEYLLHSQDYLSETAVCLEQKLNTALKEHEQTAATLKSTSEELAETKKECHRRKKMLATQQQLIQAGANAYNKCPYCTKAFINASFLQAHVSRRHSQQEPSTGVPAARMAQSVQAGVATTAASQSSTTQLEQELRTIKAQLVEERDVRMQEIDASKRERDYLLEKMSVQFAAWKDEQLHVQNAAVEQFKSMYHSQLQELEEKNKAAQAMQQALSRKIGGSNLGNLEDCVDDRVRQKKDAERAKEMLQAQVCKLESDMQARFQEQERHWSEKMRAMSISHQHKLQAVQNSQIKSASEVQQKTSEPAAGYKHKLKERNQSVKKQACKQYLAAVQQEEEEGKKKETTPEKKAKTGGLKSVLKSPRHAFMQKNTAETNKENRAPVHAEETKKHEEPTPVLSMMPINSEDEEEEEEDTTEFDPTTTFGTATLPTLGTETLSWRETKNSRLLEQMKRNPDFLPAMKTRIRALLDEELERRGIPPGLTHINNAVYESKLILLNKERQQRAMHFKNFYDIRQQYLNELEQRVRQTNNSNVAAANRSNDVVRSASLPRNMPKSAASSQSAPRAATVPRMPPQRPPPQPAPRSTSPPSVPLVQSSHWTSESYTDGDEDEDETDDDDDEDADGYEGNVDYLPTQVQRHRVTESKDGSDSEWDSGSELQEMKGLPTPRDGAASSGGNMNHNAPIQVRAPKGKMVAALSKSIGYQLQTRSGKKLPGAINTLTGDDQSAASNGRVSRNSTESVDDKDLFTVSSEDDEEESESITDPKLRRPASRRNGHLETDTSTRTSTNTLATSAWGSSRATHHPVGGASVGKSSLASVSDWDNLEDI